MRTYECPLCHGAIPRFAKPFGIGGFCVCRTCGGFLHMSPEGYTSATEQEVAEAPGEVRDQLYALQTAIQMLNEPDDW
jgi:hypothetical protein